MGSWEKRAAVCELCLAASSEPEPQAPRGRPHGDPELAREAVPIAQLGSGPRGQDQATLT